MTKANIVLAVVAGLIGLGFVIALPPERRRTSASDAAEYALLIALMTVASPLARTPTYFRLAAVPVHTLLVYRGVLDPDPVVRKWCVRLLAAALAIFTVGVSARPAAHPAGAHSNMFWASVILIGALVWLMRRSMRPADPLEAKAG